MDDLISRQALRSDMYHEAMEKDSDEQRWDGGCWIRYKMFERVIDRQPSAQPERHYDEWCTDCKEYDQEKHCCPRFNRVIRTTLQEVQGERKKGKWVPKADQRYYCSRCDEVAPKGIRWNFCPNCGAEMEDTDERT